MDRQTDLNSENLAVRHQSKRKEHEKQSTFFYEKEPSQFGKTIWIWANNNVYKNNSCFFNPFVPNALFLYHLKTSENFTVFRCFQGVEKGCIGKWVKTILIQLYCIEH